MSGVVFVFVYFNSYLLLFHTIMLNSFFTAMAITPNIT